MGRIYENIERTAGNTRAKIAAFARVLPHIQRAVAGSPKKMSIRSMCHNRVASDHGPNAK